jgi:hypothetical protein
MEDPKHTEPTVAPVAYEAPKVTDYGSLTDITAGQVTGGRTDRTFPVGTPVGTITFS